MLVSDARELLSSPARVVGAALGELHFNAWMALITHVVHGDARRRPRHDDPRGAGTPGCGASRREGGKDTFALLDVMHDLPEAKFSVPGYDPVNQPAPGRRVGTPAC